MEIEFEFEKKKVIGYNSSWKWGNYTSEAVKEISVEKFNAINKLYLKGIKETKDLKQKQLIQEQKDFKTLVSKANKAGFTTTFNDILKIAHQSDAKDVTLSKKFQDKDINARIRFNDKVWGAASWHSHRTNSPWCVEFDYKTVRYKTFERAFNKATERINLKIDSLEIQSKNTKSKLERDERIAKELSLLGLKLYNEHNRRGSDYKIGKVLKDPDPEHTYTSKVKISGEVYLEDKPIEEHEIKSIKLQGKISVENFRQLTVFLDQMVKNDKIKED